MELAGGSMAAALTLAADILARSGCMDSAIACAVSARLLGRPVLVSAPTAPPSAAASLGTAASGGLKRRPADRIAIYGDTQLVRGQASHASATVEKHNISKSECTAH